MRPPPKSARERKACMAAAAEASVRQTSRDPAAAKAVPLGGSLPHVQSGSNTAGQRSLLTANNKINTPNKKLPGSSARPAAAAAGHPPASAQQTGAENGVKVQHDEYDFLPTDEEDDDRVMHSEQHQQLQKALAQNAGQAAGKAAASKQQQRRRKVHGIDRGKRMQDEQRKLDQQQQQQQRRRHCQGLPGTGGSGDENDPAEVDHLASEDCLSAEDGLPLVRFNRDVSLRTPFAAAAAQQVGSKSFSRTFAGSGIQPRMLLQQPAAGGGKQLDIRQFARKAATQAHNVTSEPMPAGMLNHGNTCYLNAILQALLSLPSLARDLTPCSSSRASTTASHGSSLAQLQLPPDGVTAAMQVCLQQHQAACRRARGESGTSTAAISPEVVRRAMEKRASHWGAARQEDAHEFFTALLHGLSDEVQQAQLEVMKLANSTTRVGQQQQQRAIEPRATAAAAAAAGPGAAELLPCADDAAQACQPELDQAAAGAAQQAPESQPGVQQTRQEQQQQEPHQQDGGKATPDAAAPKSSGEALAAVAERGSRQGLRQPTPACQLPSMPVSQTLCPVTRNFLGCLQHTFTCSVCGHKTCVKEQFNHLILDLPADDSSSSGGGGGFGGLFNGISTQAAGAAAAAGSSRGPGAPVAELSSLLANFFAPETCEKACEGCGAAQVQHKLEHAVRRLPRVLVVQLKRFKWVLTPAGIPDCRKVPTPVQPDRQLFLGRLCVPGRPVHPLLAELMPQRLIQSAMEAAGEQQQQQQPHHHHQQQQQWQQTQERTDGTACNGSPEAATADGGLGALLPTGDVAAGSNSDAEAGQQHEEDEDKLQQQQKRQGLCIDGLQQPRAPKKPKVVDGPLFDNVPQGGVSRPFCDDEPTEIIRQTAGKRQKLTLSVPRPGEQQQQQQRRQVSWDPAEFKLGYKGQAGDEFEDQEQQQQPFGGGWSSLRRNNSSSAVPQVDLTHLAEVAGEDEYERDLQRALALSLQEQHQPGQGQGQGQEQQQQQQQEDQADQQQQQHQQGSPEATHATSDAAVPDSGGDVIPDWLEDQYAAATAAAPPASPVSSSPEPPAAGAAAGGRHAQGVTATGLASAALRGKSMALWPPPPAAAAAGDCSAGQHDLLALTPPDAAGAAADGCMLFDPSPAQQHGGAGAAATAPVAPSHHGHPPPRLALGSIGGLAPCSPALQAPRPDRSGLVSSSGAPGGNVWRLGSGTGACSGVAKAAAALQGFGGSAAARTLMQEVAAAGLSEDEMLERAIAESMKQHGSSATTTGAAAAAAAEAPAAAAAPAAVAATGDAPDVVLGSDAVEEDEDAVMKRVMAESAKEHEQQQQLKLQQLMQENGGTTALLSAAAAAAAGDAHAEAAAAGAGSSKQTAQEKPPALLLRLLEDSDYEAEQDEQQGRARQRSSSADVVPDVPARGSDDGDGGDADDSMLEPAATRCASPPSDAAAAATGKGRRSRAAKRQADADADADADAAAAAAGDGEDAPTQRPRQTRRRPPTRRQQQQRPGGSDAPGSPSPDNNSHYHDGAAGDVDAQQSHVAGDADAAGHTGTHKGSRKQQQAADNCSELDKENLAGPAAAAAAGEGGVVVVDEAEAGNADTDPVTDRSTRKAAKAAGAKAAAQKQRKVLGEILGAGSSSGRNAAAGGAGSNAVAAVGEPPQKPPAVAAAVAAARAAAAAGVSAAPAEGASPAAAAAAAPAPSNGGGGDGQRGVRALQQGVAAGAVGSWPQEAAASYSLTAVVRHMGELVSVGHFTSDVLNSETKRWFHYDDSHVRALPGIETVARTCQRDGYLFFYVNDAISDA